MTQCMHPSLFLSNRKKRKEKMLLKMANWRRRKAEIRQERIAAGLLEREPKLMRYHRFEFGVRNKLTGEMAWHDLVSVRHAAKALGLVLKYI